MSTIIASLKLYFILMGRWLWIVMFDIFLAIGGAYLDISGTVEVPTWIWLCMLIVGLLIAPFIAFHKLRLAADVAAKSSSTSAKEIFSRLSKQAVYQKNTRSVIMKRLREGKKMIEIIKKAKEYETTDKSKELGTWVTDTHHDLRENHSLVLANRFGDASTMPFNSMTLNNKIFDLQFFLQDRIKILNEMKSDIDKDT